MLASLELKLLLLLSSCPLHIYIDVDECQTDTHNCSENAECSDTHGSFNCTCNEGYDGDGLQCNSTSTRLRGSHPLRCMHIEIKITVSCTDINECEINPDICGDKAECNDTDGSYVCICSVGFSGNGSICKGR